MRTTPIDLSQLPAPDIVDELDYETILAEKKARLVSLYPKEQQDEIAATLELESEPMVKLLQEGAYEKMLLLALMNEKARGILLAYPLTKGKLRSRFDKARELAGIEKAKFQFRDLRARGVTHKTIDEGLEAGQRLAGHSGPGMTARYVRGARPVKPSR